MCSPYHSAGKGKRPNQRYLPCNCKAMLRLNYCHADDALRITTIEHEHTGSHNACLQAPLHTTKRCRPRDERCCILPLLMQSAARVARLIDQSPLVAFI